MADTLKDEVTNDPLVRGYAGMTDQQVADDINTVYRERNRTSMTADEVLQNIELSAMNLLAADKRANVDTVLSLGSLNPFGVAADIMVDAFTGGSATIVALQAARKEPISRAQELGVGAVKTGHVEEARR